MKQNRRQWGEGSYDFVESKGLFRWRGYYLDPVTGQNKRKEITATTKKNLRLKVKQWQEEVTFGQINRIKVSAWCEKWLSIINSTTKPATARNYGITVRCHIVPQWGNMWLDQINSGMIQDYINLLANTHTTKTISTIRAHIRTCMATSIKYGFLTKNPATNIKIIKKSEAEKMVLKQEEVDKLISDAKNKIFRKVDAANRYLNFCYYVVLKLAIGTGMRQGEIFALNWSDIKFSENIIFVQSSLSQIKSNERISGTKTGKCRNILIDNKTIILLRNWKKYQTAFAHRYEGIFKNTHNLVFTNSTGNFLSATNFSRRYFRPLLKEANLSEKIHFHSLRHTHASMLLARGVNVQVVAERLGHSTVSTTMNIYAHLLPTLQESAKNILEKLFEGE